METDSLWENAGQYELACVTQVGGICGAGEEGEATRQHRDIRERRSAWQRDNERAQVGAV